MSGAQDPWLPLRAAGVPVGGARPASATVIDAGAVRAALAALCDGATTDAARAWDPAAGPGHHDAAMGRGPEPLLAWLRGFRQHWPTRFADLLGGEGERALATLEALPLDANRYLKLRRIAVANLAAVL